ncbi:MAG: M3 family metallopeptidase, partial [Bacteroidetes bacterium]|nr:M3 family metallopeptidase [Bacteroidota bacterium]
IQLIATNRIPPTFENTIEALDQSGTALKRVENVFDAMLSSMNNDEMKEIAQDILPRMSQHEDAILLNADLFQRVRAVQEQRDSLSLDTEQRMLLKEWYRRFVRGGALLAPDQKERLSEINRELSVLSLEFSNSILAENNRFELVIQDPADLDGLTDAAVSAAAEAAAERGHEGKWVFTLHKPSMIPFLQSSTRRELRNEIYDGYINRGNHDDSLDNKGIGSRIVNLRIERAHLLGHATHADYVLEETMAQTPDRVYELLEKLWRPALKRARKEVRDMQAIIREERGHFRLQPSDWWYYAEKVKKAKYDLDEAMLRPYFELKNVRTGVFNLATKLYGITFTPRTDIPVYQEDVEVFEVKEADGTHIGILYVDYFPRASKTGGAWMGAFRKQHRRDETNISPLIYNVGNFTKPTAGEPSLLRVEEVETLFHEFGHALHGLLSQCTYRTLSGTDVARDFVELPSQVMENWAFEPEVLRQYARHYRTGEPIPEELIAKIKRSRTFNQGFKTVEYLAASFLDMDWSTLADPYEGHVLAFDNHSMETISLIPEIVPRYRTSYFMHMFAWEYSAGYYSYIWAEVLDADAFQAFKETGDVFDQETALAFRENILARGGSDEAMTLYKKFRGKEPSIEPLLERRGLK